MKNKQFIFIIIIINLIITMTIIESFNFVIKDINNNILINRILILKENKNLDLKIKLEKESFLSPNFKIIFINKNSKEVLRKKNVFSPIIIVSICQFLINFLILFYYIIKKKRL